MTLGYNQGGLENKGVASTLLRKQRGRIYTFDNRPFSVKQGGIRCFGGFERIADIAAFLRRGIGVKS